MTACGICGAQLAGADFLYNAQGQPSCSRCADRTDLADTDRRAAGNIVKAGWASLGAGIAAFACGMMFLGIITWLVAASSIVSAVFCFLGFGRDSQRFKNLLTDGQRATALTCSVIGLLFSALAVLGVATLIGLRLMGLPS